MKNIVVFASGSGSNFENLVKKLHGDDINVALLVCDKPKAKCITRADNLNIRTKVLQLSDFTNKEAYEREIIHTLKEINPDLIVLAGYMKLISEWLLNAYEGKIINIHPSLLPAFAGANGIADAFKYGVRIMGVSVHYVDAGIDTGPIIDQESFKLGDCDTLETVTEKIHAIEHDLYPRVIKKLLLG